MFNHENFLKYIDLIGEQIYYRTGFTDTFIVFFRHGYNINEMDDDYIIDNDFNEGQDFYIIDNVISITELRRLLNARIYDFIGKGALNNV